MSLKYFLPVIACCCTVSIRAQSILEIKIESNIKAAITPKKDGAATEFNKLDFSDGNGKLVIINTTNTNAYKISFTAGANDQNFLIPSAKIPQAAADGTEGKTELAIKNDNTMPDVPNSLIDPKAKINIDIQNAASPPATLVTFKSAGEDTPGAATPPAQRKVQNALRQYVDDQIEEKGYRYVASQNIIIDANGVIHIYLDENLSPVYSYFPTTAKEGYDKFMFHILSTKDFTYTIESSGKFDPRPLTDDISSNGFPKIQSTGSKAIFEFPSAIFGPFTGNFPFLIQRKKSGRADISLDRSVKLIKVSRVSLDVGLVATWLRNPANISTQQMPSGDTTLIADNPNVRGLIVAMLTFHFKPRNLAIPPRTFNERWGMSVGVGLSEKIGKNFFLGLNLEIANGLFLNSGAHFGEVNYPIDHKHFKYGSEKFDGTLITRKRWDVMPYVSVSVDAALFTKAFGALFNSAGTGTP